LLPGFWRERCCLACRWLTGVFARWWLTGLFGRRWLPGRFVQGDSPPLDRPCLRLLPH